MIIIAPLCCKHKLSYVGLGRFCGRENLSLSHKDVLFFLGVMREYIDIYNLY